MGWKPVETIMPLKSIAKLLSFTFNFFFFTMFTFIISKLGYPEGVFLLAKQKLAN